MPVLEFIGANGAAQFAEDQCKAVGEALHEQYINAKPFPHIVLDDFLAPALLRPLIDKFPSRDTKTHFDRDQERLKYQFAPWEVDDAALRNLLLQLNSRAFVRFLEKMSGIKGLIPDPHFSGGGLHETMPGGHLSVHADFNIQQTLKLERRLNFLLYLNDDWEDEFGGHLELWDQEMKSCQARVLPVLGRAVTFSTTLDSFHGHPDPLSCPPGRSRRSIATYYYTAPENGIASLPKRTTIFKPRAATTDKRDYKVGLQHLVNDWVPFKLQPIARKIANKLL